MLSIVQHQSAKHLALVKKLFVEYWKWLDFEPCFQDFDHELANLPGAYAAPTGCLLLAFLEGDVAGCIAIRKLNKTECEMKRLYVRPAFRGQHIGAALAIRAIEEARRLDYKTMFLDTLPIMENAIALYRGLGFKKTDTYMSCPTPGGLCMKRDLHSAPPTPEQPEEKK